MRLGQQRLFTTIKPPCLITCCHSPRSTALTRCAGETFQIAESAFS